MAKKGPRKYPTNVYTFFFREADALKMVREVTLVPRARANKPVSIWCVGSSTGEEPYSLAITALEADVQAEVVATDINRKALERARKGIYYRQSVRHVSASRRKRWFEAQSNSWEVRPEVREVVAFKYHDVTTEPPLVAPRSVEGDGGWDLIFCRNVFIYYEPEVVGETVSGLLSALKRDGLLVLGAGEWLNTRVHAHMTSVRPQLEERMGVLVYSRGSVGAMPAGPALPVTPSQPSPRPERRRVKMGRPVTGRRAEGQQKKTAKQTNDAQQASFDTARRSLAKLRRDGDELFDANEPERALEVYNEALQQASIAPDIHLRIAMCHLRLLDAEQAREALRRCLFLDADLWPAAMMLGDLLEESEPRAAKRYFVQARDLLQKGRYRHVSPPAELQPFFSARTVALEVIRLRLDALETN